MAALVLASESPRRHVLLRLLVDDFSIVASGADESAPGHLPVQDAVQVIARKKALAVSEHRRNDWVLAADTVVWHHGGRIDKPRNEGEARQRLAYLAGDTHQVWTGLALAWKGRVVDDRFAVSAVRIDPLPTAVMDAYVASELWCGKAGGYGIQDAFLAPYIHIQSGPWSNVVGLPLAATQDLLSQNGINCRTPPTETDLMGRNLFGDADSRPPAAETA